MIRGVLTRASSSSSKGVPPTRKTLLVRLKDWKDEQSWHEFYHIYEKLIRDTALKSGLRPDEAQEVVQETLLTIAKKIAGFDYNPAIGSFKNWLLQITRRRIIDQLRKRRLGTADAAGGTGAMNIDQLSDPAPSLFDAFWNAEWSQALIEMARVIVKRRVGARQYEMFNLYVLEQLPLKEVTRRLSVNAAQVYMAKYRITRLLKAELRDLERDI